MIAYIYIYIYIYIYKTILLQLKHLCDFYCLFFFMTLHFTWKFPSQPSNTNSVSIHSNNLHMTQQRWNSQIRGYAFIYAAFKLHKEWSIACISTPTITILPTTVDTFHGLNSFSHLYMHYKITRTKILQNFWPTHVGFLLIFNPLSSFLYLLGTGNLNTTSVGNRNSKLRLKYCLHSFLAYALWKGVNQLLSPS